MRTRLRWLLLNLRSGNVNGEPLHRYVPEVVWWCIRHPREATSGAAWSD